MKVFACKKILRCGDCPECIRFKDKFVCDRTFRELHTVLAIPFFCPLDDYEPLDPPGGYGVCRDTGTLSQEDIDGWE